MSRITTITLASLLITGCGHAETITGASPVTAPATVEATPTRVTPVITWGLDRSGEHPGVVVTPSIKVESIVIIADGAALWVSPGVHVELPHWGWYTVQGFATGAWSEPFAFEVVANPNGSGERVTPTLPIPAAYNQTRCTIAADFGPGQSEVLTFNAPPGNYAVTATTYEVNHAPGFQLGQVETVMIGGFGSTEDVGDLENVHVSPAWSTPLAVNEVRVTGLRGSLHGRPSAVCVTVESR